MLSAKEYYDLIDNIAGKTIAIVYIFEGETAAGFKHYDVWKSRLISCWLNAIQELHCIPYIVDVRTFLLKVSNGTLPPVDYVINMNAGCINLSTLGLIPSVCGFEDLECIPCNTSSIISGENKDIANMIADYCGFKIPKEMAKNEGGIFRPLNFGSSKGVALMDRLPSEHIPGIYQEFIPGYDATTPIMYNPISNRMDAMPTVFYSPDQNDVTWFLGEQAKKTSAGFERRILDNVDCDFLEKCIIMAKKFDIDTYCRIDWRLRSDRLLDHSDIYLNQDNGYFIEMNPMPTIESGNNFYVSFNNIGKRNAFFDTVSYYKEHVCNPTIHGFILSCSIIGRSISRHKK